MIDITKISYFPVKPTNKGLIGFASCVINNSISLNSIAIYTSKSINGKFDIRLLYPARETKNGRRIQYYHPMDKASADKIRIAILEQINMVIRKNVRDR